MPRTAASRRPPPARAAAPSARPGPAARGPSRVTLAVWAIFAAGLLLRLAIFARGHEEGDEVVYRVLTGQLRDGHGYTLAGTPLIGRDYPASQYGRALFFHPPGGIVLFLLLYDLFGISGFPIAQMLSFAVFFWSIRAAFRRLLPDAPDVATLGVAALAALTPIMSHVTVHYWLDGPLLALATLATALFLEANRRRSLAGAALAGVALGLAAWIKTTGFLAHHALPLVPLLAFAAAEPEERAGFFARAAVFAIAAALVQLPWELWQWAVVGSPFPVWAGRPAPELIRNNAYVYMLTVTRSPWIYASWIPRVVWTLVPALLALLLPAPPGRGARIGPALAAWAAFVIAVHVGLGLIGYSKVLRYAILVTPASVLLFGVALTRAWSARRAPRWRAAAIVALIALGAGITLELAQGAVTTFDRQDLITPLFMQRAARMERR